MSAEISLPSLFHDSKKEFAKNILPYLATGCIVIGTNSFCKGEHLKIINWDNKTNIICFQSLETKKVFRTPVNDIRVANVPALQKLNIVGKKEITADLIRIEILKEGIGWLKENMAQTSATEFTSQIVAIKGNLGIWNPKFINRNCESATKVILKNIAENSLQKEGIISNWSFKRDHYYISDTLNKQTPKLTLAEQLHLSKIITARENDLKNIQQFFDENNLILITEELTKVRSELGTAVSLMNRLHDQSLRQKGRVEELNITIEKITNTQSIINIDNLFNSFLNQIQEIRTYAQNTNSNETSAYALLIVLMEKLIHYTVYIVRFIAAYKRKSSTITIGYSSYNYVIV